VTAWSSAGYGRIVRVDGRSPASSKGDASRPSAKLREINSGIYAFDLAPLFDARFGASPRKRAREFYLTDLT
jgi:bifunctional UDP-N-acetylglucosamine pyrophosphorylase/glucosamine-1-phosphate N-acetyltransferase